MFRVLTFRLVQSTLKKKLIKDMHVDHRIILLVCSLIPSLIDVRYCPNNRGARLDRNDGVSAFRVCLITMVSRHITAILSHSAN
jgi:hypothetical protein